MRWSVLVLLLVLAVSATPTPADEFDDARKKYEKGMRAATLLARTQARAEFAEVGDHRALELIARRYGKPEVPRDQVRALIASIVGAYGNTKQDVAILDALREKHAKRRDAWLWYQALLRRTQRLGPEVALDAASDARLDPFLRAAALEALVDGERGCSEALARIPGILAALPKAPPDRAVLVESCARVLWAMRADVKGDAFHAAAQPLIRLMDDKATLARTRLSIARYLGRIFASEALYPGASQWLRRLEWERVPDDSWDPRYARPKWRPTFVGIPATGSRIAYVIDVSGSMSEPLSVEERRDLRKKPRKKPGAPPVVTGRPGEGAADAPEGPAAEKTPSLADVPWHKVRTRLDAVREFLKLSLRMLRPEQEFVVVWFETQAMLLAGTKGPAKATKTNVERAIRKLDARSAVGATNMHGGIRLAFASAARRAKGTPYVSVEGLLGGCDTVFVLSDGEPNVDDWSGGATPGGPIFRSSVSSSTELEPGFLDFATPYQLVDDVRRLNLFRKCEIHCVGIGDASRDLLAHIARLGHGKVRYIGAGGIEEVDPAKEEGEQARVAESARGLLRTLQGDPDPAERADAAEMLGMFRWVDAVLPLVEALDDAEESVRRAASDALGVITDNTGIAYVLPPNADPVHRAKMQVAWRAWFRRYESTLREKHNQPKDGG